MAKNFACQRPRDQCWRPFLGFGVGFRAWAPNLSEQRLAWGHLVKDFASSLNRGRNLDAPSASSNWRSRAHVQ